jgi:hypothetical protein
MSWRSDRQQFPVVRPGAGSAGARCQPFLDEIAKPLPGLFFLVAPNQVTDLFAGVAVVSRGDSGVDVLAHRFGQGKAHGLSAHGSILDRLTTVANSVAGQGTDTARYR